MEEGGGGGGEERIISYLVAICESVTCARARTFFMPEIVIVHGEAEIV